MGAKKPRVYGQWAGNPKGTLEDVSLCIESVMPNERAPIAHQCRRKRGHGPGGLYCAQHNPERLKAREDAVAERRRKEDAHEAEIRAEGRRLIDGLGCGEVAYQFDFNYGNKHQRHTRRLHITFEEAEKLLRRLNREAAPPAERGA